MRSLSITDLEFDAITATGTRPAAAHRVDHLVALSNKQSPDGGMEPCVRPGILEVLRFDPRKSKVQKFSRATSRPEPQAWDLSCLRAMSLAHSEQEESRSTYPIFGNRGDLQPQALRDAGAVNELDSFQG